MTTSQTLPLDSLTPDPENARVHSDRNLAAITDSIVRFGQVEPLVVQKDTRRVIGGNGRLEAMRALNWTEAECMVVEITDVEARALGIALNRTGELAGWDHGRLAMAFQDLGVDGANTEDLGFSTDELRAFRDLNYAARQDAQAGLAESSGGVTPTAPQSGLSAPAIPEMEGDGISDEPGSTQGVLFPLMLRLDKTETSNIKAAHTEWCEAHPGDSINRALAGICAAYLTSHIEAPVE